MASYVGRRTLRRQRGELAMSPVTQHPRRWSATPPTALRSRIGLGFHKRFERSEPEPEAPAAPPIIRPPFDSYTWPRLALNHYAEAGRISRESIPLIMSTVAIAFDSESGSVCPRWGPCVADALNASPSTILRRFDRLGIPTPRKWVAWGRIVVAAEVMASGSTGERAARVAGYSSGDPLRHAVAAQFDFPPRFRMIHRFPDPAWRYVADSWIP